MQAAQIRYGLNLLECFVLLTFWQTVSAVTTFFLTMTLYPEVQKRAQEEIDAVIGPDRLPTIEDRESLPYVRALVSEVLRWGPIAPQGVPHRTIEDESYEGFFIPKGSLLIPNIWLVVNSQSSCANVLNITMPGTFFAKIGRAHV